jgi:hypothetical protein
MHFALPTRWAHVHFLSVIVPLLGYNYSKLIVSGAGHLDKEAICMQCLQELCSENNCVNILVGGGNKKVSADVTKTMQGLSSKGVDYDKAAMKPKANQQILKLKSTTVEE